MIQGQGVTFCERQWQKTLDKIKKNLDNQMATLHQVSIGDLIAFLLGGELQSAVKLSFPDTSDRSVFHQYCRECLAELFKAIEGLLHPTIENDQGQDFQVGAMKLEDIAYEWHYPNNISALFQPVFTDIGTSSRGDIQVKMTRVVQDQLAANGDMIVTLEIRHSCEWFTERLWREQNLIRSKRAQEACLKVKMIHLKAIAEYEKFEEYRLRFRHAKKSQRKIIIYIQYRNL